MTESAIEPLPADLVQALSKYIDAARQEDVVAGVPRLVRAIVVRIQDQQEEDGIWGPGERASLDRVVAAATWHADRANDVDHKLDSTMDPYYVKIDRESRVRGTQKPSH
ncbi:hypothetical protein [Curtobacterium flaccumfaciens]|uniref:hypothetical protein n=1 Tax=Curtobacterium flaccumfaciens TaxID=2035 RepID=UPI001E40D9D5|nr:MULTISPECIES: hypothetical protein [Curtobacterium]MCE0457854.1 hypothetical protein [Curtobacterium allii]MCS5522243.1 hypothetical protein [Curtobacterium flaccumfaciens pv. oortii]UWD79180.1 hypothetical protein NY058_17520 [Curtobacterium flaccumfaciens]